MYFNRSDTLPRNLTQNKYAANKAFGFQTKSDRILSGACGLRRREVICSSSGLLKAEQFLVFCRRYIETRSSICRLTHSRVLYMYLDKKALLKSIPNQSPNSQLFQRISQRPSRVFYNKLFAFSILFLFLMFFFHFFLNFVSSLCVSFEKQIFSDHKTKTQSNIDK